MAERTYKAEDFDDNGEFIRDPRYMVPEEVIKTPVQNLPEPITLPRTEPNETTEERTAWQALANRSQRTRFAREDFIASIEHEKAVIEAGDTPIPGPPIDGREEVVKAVWGAATDVASEGSLFLKDMARDILPLDKAMAGLAYSVQGQPFFEGVAEADADNARFNDEVRAAADFIAPANETAVGGLARGILTFMVPYMGVTKAAGVLNFAEATAAGAVLDMALWDPNEGNLSNLIKELSPDTQSVVLDFLATDPDDSESANRLRNALEGGVLGTALEGVFKFARWRLAKDRLDTVHDQVDHADYEVDLELPEVEAPRPDLVTEVRSDGVDIAIPRAEDNKRVGLFSDEGIHLTESQDGRIELQSRGDNLQVTRSLVDTELRGKGEGVRLYEAAALEADKAGKPLVSDSSITESAGRVWKSLEKRGHTINDQRVTNPNNIETRVNERGTTVYETKNGTPVISRDAPAPQVRESEVFGMDFQVRDQGVRLDDIELIENQFTGTTQGVDEASVSDIRKVIRNGEQVDPITVRRREDGAYELVDGHHRLEAMKREGLETSDVFRITDEEEFATRQSQSARQADEGARVLDEIEIGSDLRGTFKLTKDQADAYIKAIESDDPNAVGEVIKGINDDTIDWSKIESAEDIRLVLRAGSEVFAEQIQNVGNGVKGVQTNAQTRRLGNLVGNSGDNVHSLHKDLTDGVGITARMHKAELTLLSSARELYRLRAVAKEEPGNLAHKANFMRHLQLHAALQAEVTGAKKEIARAMQGMQIIKAEASDGFKEFNEILRQFGGNARTGQQFERFMDDLLDGRDLRDLNAKIRQTAGERAKNVIIEWVINAMLSSPKTHAINIASNVVNTLLYPLDRLIGGVVRYAAGDPRLLREAAIDLMAKRASLGEAWDLSKQAWRDGAPVTDKRQRLEFQTRKAIAKEGTTDIPRAGDEELAEAGSRFHTPAREVIRDESGTVVESINHNWFGRTINTLGNYVRTPGRALITGDEFFKAVNRNSEIKVLSYRKADADAVAQGLEYGTKKYETFVEKQMKLLMDPENVSNAAREIRSRAVAKSRLTTFQETAKTPLGGAMEKAINSNAFVKLVIAPFFRTPMNILRQGVVDRTPLGLVLEENRTLLRNGTANEKAEILARSTTGIAAMWAGYEWISRGGPDEAYEFRGRPEYGHSGSVEGIGDYSIRIGDTWYQFNRLDPLGLWLGTMVDMETAVRHHDDTNKDEEEFINAMMQGAMAGFYNNVMNKTWAKSLADLLELGEGMYKNKPETTARAWGKFSAGQVGKFIPQIVKSTGTALEGERVYKEAWTTFDGLAAGMPFFGQDLPPRHDVLGRPMTKEMSMWSVVNPFATSPDSTDPVDKVFGDLGFTILPMPRSIAGGQIMLNAEEYSRLTGLVGETGIHEQLRERILRDDWESLTPDRQVYEIKARMKIARQTARLRFIKDPVMLQRFKDATIAEKMALISGDE